MKKLFLLALMISLTGLQAQKADEIAQKYIEKIGGEKLKQVHSILQKGTMTVNGMDFPMENYKSDSGKMFIKLNMMGQDIVALAFDGQKGYKFDNFAYTDIPDSLAARFKEKAQNLFGYFYNYKAHGRHLKYLGQQKMDSIQAETLQMTFDQPIEGGVKDFVAYFNPKTGLLMAIKVVKDGHIVITKPTDYKTFDGVLLPTKIINEVDGNTVQTMTFDTVKINPPEPDPAIFIKPKQ